MVETFSEKSKKKDISYLLYLIAESTQFDGIKGRTRLEKLVFLCKLNGLDVGYTFKFWSHGPYSKDIIEDLNELVAQGLVEENYVESSDWWYDPTEARCRYDYKITEKGKDAIKELENILVQDDKKIIQNIVKKYNDLDIDTLLRKVYQTNVTKIAKRSGFGSTVL